MWGKAPAVIICGGRIGHHYIGEPLTLLPFQQWHERNSILAVYGSSEKAVKIV